MEDHPSHYHYFYIYIQILVHKERSEMIVAQPSLLCVLFTLLGEIKQGFHNKSCCWKPHAFSSKPELLCLLPKGCSSLPNLFYVIKCCGYKSTSRRLFLNGRSKEVSFFTSSLRCRHSFYHFPKSLGSFSVAETSSKVVVMEKEPLLGL